MEHLRHNQFSPTFSHDPQGFVKSMCNEAVFDNDCWQKQINKKDNYYKAYDA